MQSENQLDYWQISYYSYRWI